MMLKGIMDNRRHDFHVGEYWISRLDPSTFHICIYPHLFLKDAEFDEGMLEVDVLRVWTEESINWIIY